MSANGKTTTVLAQRGQDTLLGHLIRKEGEATSYGTSLLQAIETQVYQDVS
jgi:hypothetical protein